MTTPLDIHALRQLTELAAAQQLVAMSRAELWAIVETLKVRVRGKASKEDLVAAILEATHPKPAQRAAAPVAEQQRMF